jgi:Fic family protein
MRRIKRHIHELADWPKFRWDRDRLAKPLASVRHQQGRLIGHMEALGFQLQQEAVLKTLTEDVVKSSDIEGEKLDINQVRSSVARRLGMEVGGLKAADRHVEGVVEMMLDATRKYDKPLTVERLLAWHASLFPTGRTSMRNIRVGAWRDDKTGPMQVVSGPIGREHVHFEAPAARRLNREMKAFVNWFNKGADIDAVLKAGLAHLWLVTIHPFDDGNGRIARAIADLALARSEHSQQRFYSMSAQIREERECTTGFWNRPRRARWMSRPGWNGFSPVSVVQSTARKRRSQWSCTKHDFGNRFETHRSMNDSACCSIVFLMASKAT